MSQNHRPIWHEESKQQQLMEGDELLLLGKQYLNETIKRDIPREIKDSGTVRSMSIRGTTETINQLAQQNQAVLLSKKQRRKKKNSLTL